ncbi:hypothetical protein D9758_002876 [Tetrapyrgos nigripes]|uniref:Uncharacterized protein n=1 Tax=Tetrapyrgos nigripes TaxID=182062 RepID=A0A8H5LTL9_9AGAR|nr:hypothetical protein D9758_002876 [Tetrapyrgos nigripes]
MSLACSYSVEAMAALASSSSPRMSSSQRRATSKYIPNDDPDSYFNTADVSNDSGIPPRPTSRLGFHDMDHSPSPSPKSRSSSSRSRSATFKWTRSLIQKMRFDSSSSATVVTEPTEILEARAGLIHDDDEDVLTIMRNIPASLPSRDNLSLEDMSFSLSSGSDDEQDGDDSDLSDSDFDLDSLSLSDLEDPREPCPSFPQTSISAITTPSFYTSNPDPSCSPASTSLFSSSSHSTVSDEFESSDSITISSVPVPAIPEKYSSLPSPFSPSFTISPTPIITPTRHIYGDHGHSRHSLYHQKWFWGAREEAWAQYSAHLNGSDAYAGMMKTSPEEPVTLRFPLLFSSARTTVPNSRRLWTDQDHHGDYGHAHSTSTAVEVEDSGTTLVPVSGQAVLSTFSSASPQPQPQSSSPSLSQSPSPPLPLPPMTLHPRWGDLESLRDAWCVHMDRYFVGIPLWSIRKSLWMFDVHVLGMVMGSGSGKSSSGSCRRARRIKTRTRTVRMGQMNDGDESAPTTDNGEYEDEDGHDECSCSFEDEDGDGGCDSGSSSDLDLDLDANSMRMSMLTGFSDDSDITLVESDLEDDIEGGEESDARRDEDVDGGAGGSETRTGREFDGYGEEEFFEDVDLDGYAHACGSFADNNHSGNTSSFSAAETTPTTPTPSTSTLNSASASSSSSAYCANQTQSFDAYFSSAVECTPPQVHPSYAPLFLSRIGLARSYIDDDNDTNNNSKTDVPKLEKEKEKKEKAKEKDTRMIRMSRVWETNWYKRSEVLLQLTRRDREVRYMQDSYRDGNRMGGKSERRKSSYEEEDVAVGVDVDVGRGSTNVGLGISISISMNNDDSVMKSLSKSSSTNQKSVCA